jgi:hypothetical protein
VFNAPFDPTLITVFPNPMSEGTLFLVKGDRTRIRDLSVTNLSGQEVRRYQNVMETSVAMPRNGLPSGAYFYQAIMEDGTVSTGKLVVQ